MLQLRPKHFWAIAVLMGAFVSVASAPLVPPDLWWTLNLGRLMAETGRLVSEDPFAFAPHAPGQINAQWLAQAIHYGAYSLGGLETVILLNAVVATSTLTLVLVAAWSRCGSPRLAAFALALGFLLASRNLGARAQLLAYLLFSASLLILYWHQRSPRLLWLLPLLQVAWVNIHGSFFLQPVLIGLFGMGSAAQALLHQNPKGLGATRRLAAAGTGSLLATLANPYGPEITFYVFRVGTNPVIREWVTEWAPATVNSDYGAIFYASLALAVGCLYLSRLRLNVTDSLLLVVFAYLGLASIRGIVWWGLVLPPLLAPYLAALPWPASLMRPRTEPPPRALLNVLILAMVVAASIASLPWLKPINPLFPPVKRTLYGPETPVQVAEFLKTRVPPGRMFNYDGWGGFLGWQLWPTQQIFVDGRIEIVPPEVWFDYLKLSFGVAQWRELADKYQIGYFVLHRERQVGLIEVLSREPGWQLVYEDELAAIFEPRPAGPS